MRFTVINTNISSLSYTYNLFDNSYTGDRFIFISLDDYGDEPIDNWQVDYFTEDFFTFTPPEVILQPIISKRVNISINNLFDLNVGDYTFYLTLKNIYAGDLILPISIKVINENNLPPIQPTFDYKLKYEIIRNDYRLGIYENLPSDEIINPIEINGTTELNYQDRKDFFEPIIASNLRLNLEASKDLSFIDLYSEEEKQFKVILTHLGQTRFIGFLKPDGIFEDWVSDKWKLDISVIDGLSTLKNLYFSNENGTSVLSKMSILDVINICLNKTGLILPLNISVKVYYEGVKVNKID